VYFACPNPHASNSVILLKVAWAKCGPTKERLETMRSTTYSCARGAIVQVTAQIKTCEDLKNGVFYSYPKNASEQYQLTRKGDIQKETDLITSDSSM
jgi:hypothetical protein